VNKLLLCCLFYCVIIKFFWCSPKLFYCIKWSVMQKRLKNTGLHHTRCRYKLMREGERRYVRKAFDQRQHFICNGFFLGDTTTTPFSGHRMLHALFNLVFLATPGAKVTVSVTQLTAYPCSKKVTRIYFCAGVALKTTAPATQITIYFCSK